MTTTTCRAWPTSSRRSPGTQYRPWFIFEDGRPWPDEDWELTSTYRAVIETQRDDDVFQWGPLTFAHNTPFLYTFWLEKYWRIREMRRGRLELDLAAPSNHDTLRRGTQVSPELNINTRLGKTRMEILDKAYDNPAVHTLTYWRPARRADGFPERDGARLLGLHPQPGRQVRRQGRGRGGDHACKWQVDEYSYSMPANFRRLKELGFETRADLARFCEFLPALVEVTEYDLEDIARLLNATEPKLAGPHLHGRHAESSWRGPGWTTCTTTAISRIRCRGLDPIQLGFTLALRDFRRATALAA